MNTTDKFNFKSALCTSRGQSKRLLALGLKKETADMHWYYTGEIFGWQCSCQSYKEAFDFPFRSEDLQYIRPAWSLHRLIEMMPTHIYQGEHGFYRTIKPHSILYIPVDMESIGSIGRVVVNTNNYYDGIIEMYEWLIKEGCFKKDYLENEMEEKM